MSSVLAQKIIDTAYQDIDTIFQDNGKIFTFLNPVSYLNASKHISLFSQFDGIFADGSLLVKAIRCCYNKEVKRYSFDMTSLAPHLLNYAEKSNKTLYIVASKQEQIEKAITIFKSRYPKLNIIGYRNGYFDSPEDIMNVSRLIVNLKPDFLIVGMGIVAQEQFLLKVKQEGFAGIGFTCGGFIHQTAKNEIDYYPEWIDKYNLRFLYRMYKEKHTRKRYLQAAFIFPIKFIIDNLF